MEQKNPKNVNNVPVNVPEQNLKFQEQKMFRNTFLDYFLEPIKCSELLFLEHFLKHF